MRIFFAGQGRPALRDLRRGVLYVRRSWKPAENAAQREKDHLRMDTNWLSQFEVL
jgi:hypothetical protein